jgi:hypothetical protein
MRSAIQRAGFSAKRFSRMDPMTTASLTLEDGMHILH